MDLTDLDLALQALKNSFRRTPRSPGSLSKSEKKTKIPYPKLSRAHTQIETLIFYTAWIETVALHFGGMLKPITGQWCGICPCYCIKSFQRWQIYIYIPVDGIIEAADLHSDGISWLITCPVKMYKEKAANLMLRFEHHSALFFQPTHYYVVNFICKENGMLLRLFWWKYYLPLHRVLSIRFARRDPCTRGGPSWSKREMGMGNRSLNEESFYRGALFHI